MSIRLNKWWILAAMTSCISMIFIEVSVLPVALPTLSREFGFSEVGLQWVINAYTLALTVFVLAGGRLGDMLGHRYIFCWGLALFTLASTFCGLSLTGWWLITGRVLQGIGGALLLPSTQAILTAAFLPSERGKAIGIYVSIGSVFLATGPFIGGLLTQYLSWRYVFWMNIPIAAFGLTLTLLCVPPSEKKKESFDLIGFITLALGIASLIFAFMQGQKVGWTSPLIMLLFLLGLALISLLIFKERSIEHPLIDFTIFKNRVFTVCSLCTSLNQFIIMVTVFWVIYFQEILGYSPAVAGAYAFVANIPVLVMAPLAGHLVDRHGPKVSMILGFALIAFSLGWFVLHAHTPSLKLLLPALIPFGCGVPFVFTPSFASMMNNIPPTKRGIASSITITLRQFSATVGLALFGALFFKIRDSSALNPSILAFQTINGLAALLALGGLLFVLFLMRVQKAKELGSD